MLYVLHFVHHFRTNRFLELLELKQMNLFTTLSLIITILRISFTVYFLFFNKERHGIIREVKMVRISVRHFCKLSDVYLYFCTVEDFMKEQVLQSTRQEKRETTVYSWNSYITGTSLPHVMLFPNITCNCKWIKIQT